MVLAVGEKTFEIPGNEDADINADAITAFFENCLRFIFYVFVRNVKFK